MNEATFLICFRAFCYVLFFYGVYVQYSYILRRLDEIDKKEKAEEKLKDNKFHIPVYTNVPPVPPKKEK